MDKRAIPAAPCAKLQGPTRSVVRDVQDQYHACQHKLPFVYVSETSQVFDLPVQKFTVTEHHVMQAICSCSHPEFDCYWRKSMIQFTINSKRAPAKR